MAMKPLPPMKRIMNAGAEPLGPPDTAATSGSFNSGKNAPKQCTAKSKRSQLQCKGPAVLGSTNDRCRMHGGKSLNGTDNPNYKTGRYSRYLPSRMAELYEEALANPDLIEMGDHIALLEARIQDILSELDEGEPVPRWKNVAEVWADVETAILSDDHNTRVAGMERMHRLLDSGMQWDRTWGEVAGTMEQLRKMTDTEVKRKKELNQMVPIERVTILMGAVSDAVKRNVTDPEQIAAVYREIAMLYGGQRKTHGGDTLVGPEVINVPSDTNRGPSGGGSKPALKRSKQLSAAV